ncbi:MAG: hypothetical protein IJL21_01020 [Alphaproteobacteria bacterium]|nr:hypothetical protein [Alphaproteobacteria bacterium]
MITEEIRKVLNDLDKILRSAVGPRDRREYMREIGVTDRNWHFSLTAWLTLVFVMFQGGI